MRKFTDAALREFEIEVFGEPVDVEDIDDLDDLGIFDGLSDDEELQALLEEVENDLDAQEYEVITCEQLQEMIRDHERVRIAEALEGLNIPEAIFERVKCGTFLVENEDGTYTAAESALGCLWVEDFRTKRAAEAWLAGMDTEDAHRLDEVEDAQRRCIEHAKKTIRKEAPWILG